MVVEHLREGRLEYELTKCDELREPPLPVTVAHLYDSEHAGLLYGWAANPTAPTTGGAALSAACESSPPASTPSF